MKNLSRGSVLMEFIIVLPIYCIFLGLTFFFGELCLHGINLAASGDRTYALSYGWQGRQEKAGISFPTLDETRTAIAEAISPFSNRVDNAVKYVGSGNRMEKVSNLDGSERAGLVADRSFSGAWSWLVAATVKDNYALTPWTRGIIMPWRVIQSDLNETTLPSELDDLLTHNKIGRTMMTSRPVGNVTRYAYYTLTRKGDGFDTGSYRRWGTGRIVDAVAASSSWNNCVYLEAFPVEGEKNSSGGVFRSQIVDRSPSEGQPAGSHQGARPDYVRYDTFVKWSE